MNRVPVARTLVKDRDTFVRPGERLSLDLPGLDDLIRHGAVEMVPKSATRPPGGQPITWSSAVRLERYDTGDTLSRRHDPEAKPDQIIERAGNLLVIGGASWLLERLIGDTLDPLDGTAVLQVGDSETAESATQTALQAAVNKTSKTLDSGFPTHTHSTSDEAAMSLVLQATFEPADGNHAWKEWCARSSGGLLLNRRVESLGTKPSVSTWVLAVTLGLA